MQMRRKEEWATCCVEIIYAYRPFVILDSFEITISRCDIYMKKSNYLLLKT